MGLWDFLIGDCEGDCSSNFECIIGFCLPVPSVCDGCDESATCIPDLQNLGQFICWSEEMCECEEDYDTWCSYNICMNWIDGIEESFKAPLKNSPFNLNHFSSLTRYGLDDLNEGSITGLIGNIISLDSAITSLTSLIFNCEDIEDCTSIDSTGLFLLNGGQQVSMDLFDCSMQQVGVFIGEEAQLHIGQANVDVLSTLSLSLLTDALLEFEDITLFGTMVINGEGWVDLVLDTSAASLLTLNGGISLAGELGPVTVEVNSAWAYEGDISVRSLTSAGNWIGTGTVSVIGELILQGAGVQPWLSIMAEAILTLDSSGFVGSDLSIGGVLNIFNHDVNLPPYFELISACPDSGLITVDISNMSNIMTFEPVTILRYGVRTDYNNFECEVNILEPTGRLLNVDMNSDVLSSLSNNPSSMVKSMVFNPQHRHLLSDNADSTCAFGEWLNGSLVVSMWEGEECAHADIDSAPQHSSYPGTILLFTLICMNINWLY